MSDSLPEKLASGLRDRLVEELGMSEVGGEAGGAYLPLASQMPLPPGPGGVPGASVGEVRLFKGGKGVSHMVTCSIVVPDIFLDSHMLFIFTDKDSAVPHFTLDSVKAGDHWAFHLDMIPRADLGANLDYMNATFDPLTETYSEATKIEGLTPAHLSPKQFAIMSPWMLAFRANEEAFSQIDTAVEAYCTHWLTLLRGGVESPVDADTLAARDTANRAIIFDPAVDPVWERIEALIGSDAVAETRRILKTNDV